MKYFATINWERQSGERFIDGKYNRKHHWSFDGGLTINGSASPNVVPSPFSDPTAIDPEEAFVASISSCHMLFFLWYCAKEKFNVHHYTDKAAGIMGKGDDGREQMLTVTLSPVVLFEGENKPSKEQLAHLHELSHESCYIANSVKTKIEVVY